MAFIRLTSGRKIIAPASNIIRPNTIRPTAIRARKSLFDMLAHRLVLKFEDKIVLDGFAGAGTLGFEALERDAAQVIFIDNNKAALEQIILSAKSLGRERKAITQQRDMAALGTRPKHLSMADIVFLDPPYRQKQEQSALTSLYQGGWLAHEAVIILESAADDNFPLTNFTLQVEHQVGNKKWRVLTAMK